MGIVFCKHAPPANKRVRKSRILLHGGYGSDNLFLQPQPFADRPQSPSVVARHLAQPVEIQEPPVEQLPLVRRRWASGGVEVGRDPSNVMLIHYVSFNIKGGKRK
jgi:hypothetical protein